MKHLLKRCGALLLSLALLLPCLIPIPSAFAAENPQEDPEYYRWNEETAGTVNASVSNSNATVNSSFEDYTPRALRSGETLHYGIDISVWQRDIDWEAVAADGIEFAIIRVGYRAYATGTLTEDTYFRKNIQGALAAGIKVGVYFFSQAITQREAIAEARYVISRIKSYHVTLPIAMDFEYVSSSSGTTGRLYEAKLSRAKATQICNAFAKTVQNAGYDALVYANKSMLSSALYPSSLKCPVWLAHYAEKTDYTGSYEFWQCGSSGSVDGISTRCDMDFWFRPGVDSDDGDDDDDDDDDEMPFTDVHKSDWFYDDVLAAWKIGLVNGTSDTLFSPNCTTSRAEVVTMLYRMAGSPSVSGSTGFIDLTQDWYKQAVLWAKQQGIVEGYSADRFAPANHVTRQELAVMLWRMDGKKSSSYDISGFRDAGSVADWAQTAMRWAVQNGLINGRSSASGTSLSPLESASRAEVTAILMRYVGLSD